jgi:hypothetical protein
MKKCSELDSSLIVARIGAQSCAQWLTPEGPVASKGCVATSVGPGSARRKRPWLTWILPYQNRIKTLSIRTKGLAFERRADSPYC